MWSSCLCWYCRQSDTSPLPLSRLLFFCSIEGNYSWAERFCWTLEIPSTLYDLWFIQSVNCSVGLCAGASFSVAAILSIAVSPFYFFSTFWWFWNQPLNCVIKAVVWKESEGFIGSLAALSGILPPSSSAHLRCPSAEHTMFQSLFSLSFL